MRGDDVRQWAFQLAGHLRMTVAELMERMTWREFMEWQQWYRLEPFGPIRGDMQAGIVASTAANMFRDKGQPILKPSDFILEFGERDVPEQSQEEQMAICHLIHKALGGK